MFETVEDLLPEHVRYRDEGCELFPSCLSCPLPQCRYDGPERRQMAKELRNEEVVCASTARATRYGSSPNDTM
jgi:hypothetical protein